MPFSTAWISDSHLAAEPVALYAGVFVLVNATYVVLAWEVVDPSYTEHVQSRMRRMMRIRSLATLAVFSAAALISLASPISGLVLICLSLLLYVRPEAPWVKR